MNSSPRFQPAGPPAHPCRLGPRHFSEQSHGIRPTRGCAGSWPKGVYPGSVASPGSVCHSKEYGTRQQTGACNLGLRKSLPRVSGELVGPHAYSPPALTSASHRSLGAAIPTALFPGKPRDTPVPQGARSGVPTVPLCLTPPPTSRRLLLSALGKAD